MSTADDSIREIRINPIVPSESVLVSTARGMRPRKEEAPAPRDTRKHVDRCPFCTGNEHMTPPTVATSPSDENWPVRVVENLYPVLGDDSTSTNLVFGLQQAIDGYGRHEVIIDHPEHGIAIAGHVRRSPVPPDRHVPRPYSCALRAPTNASSMY